MQYAKDNEQQHILILNIDVMNGKRVSNVQYEQSEEKGNELISEQRALYKLIRLTKMPEEGSTKLDVAMNNRKFNEIDIAEVFITAASAKLTVLKIYQLIENSENSNQLRKTKKKIND